MDGAYRFIKYDYYVQCSAMGLEIYLTVFFISKPEKKYQGIVKLFPE